MKKLNIGIDIDGTVTEPYYWLKQANSYFDTHVDPREITRYDMHEALNVPSEEFEKFYEIFGESIHQNAMVIKNAPIVIRNLYEDHAIHFITARDPKMKAVTKYWLSKFNFPMDSLTLLGSHNKVNKAHELNCDIFIEDRYENALQLSREGILVILVNCSYNQGILPKNVIRVNSWNEIGNIIEDFAASDFDLAL